MTSRLVPGARIWKAILDRRTAAILWTLLLAVAVSTLAASATLVLGTTDSQRAFTTIGSDTAPTINDALDIYFALSDMDAYAAEYLLLNGRGSGDLSPVGVLNTYEQRRQTASVLLVSAAANPAYGASERRSILRMLVTMQIFDAYVGEAEVLNDHGARADALASYRQATDLMHAPFSGLLETALGLAASAHARLEAGYESARADERRDVTLIAISLVLLTGSLVALQIVFAMRMKRTLNGALVVATIAALVLQLPGLITLSSNDNDLLRGKNAFDSIYTLREARAIAYDARADRNRNLVDQRRAQFYQESFSDKSIELVGALDRVQSHLTFSGEKESASTALAAYDKFSREAVRDSGPDFSAFGDALDRWIQIDQRAFDQVIAAGNGNLQPWQLLRWLAVLIAGLAYVGLHRHLREYTWTGGDRDYGSARLA